MTVGGVGVARAPWIESGNEPSPIVVKPDTGPNDRPLDSRAARNPEAWVQTRVAGTA